MANVRGRLKGQNRNGSQTKETTRKSEHAS